MQANDSPSVHVKVNGEWEPAPFKIALGEDAGNRAAALMRVKAAAYRTARVLRWTLYGVVALAIIGIGALGYWGYLNKTTEYLVDTRSCLFKVGNVELTGTRTYSYPSTEIFGVRFIDTKHIDEKTKLNLNGSPLTIIGQDSDKWWAVNIDQGERGVQVLKPADSYSFIMGKQVGVVAYRALCN